MAAGLAEVGAGEVFAVLLQVAHRLVDLDELQRQRLAGLVVLVGHVAVRILVRGDVSVDRAHHLPGAGHLHVAEGCSCTGRRRQATGMRVTVWSLAAVLLRALLHPDVHQGQLVALGLKPEIDGVLLLGHVLVVEDGIGEPAIAFHAAHDLDLRARTLQALRVIYSYYP